MSDKVNMDHKKNPNATTPQLEFTIPIDEIGENLEVGQVGTIEVPVEVISQSKDSVSFRKRGKAKVPVEFREIGLDDMEKEIGLGER